MFFHFLCAQHVLGINITILRSLRLLCRITTLVELFLVRCVLEFRFSWFGVVSVLQAEFCNTDTTVIWTDWSNRKDRMWRQFCVLYFGMKGTWNEEEIFAEKPEVKTARIWVSLIGTLRSDMDLGIINTDIAVYCSVYLLLIAATWWFLSLYCIIGDKCVSSVLRKSKYSEMRPVVVTQLHTVSTLGSGSYKSQWEQVTIQ